MEQQSNTSLHLAFVKNFNKEQARKVFKAMDVQELQDTEKRLAIWVKDLKKFMTKINNT